MRYILLLLVTFLATGTALGQGTIRVTVPDDTPSHWTIAVVGSFNNWNTATPEYPLVKQGDGTYAITLPTSIRGPIEFKLMANSFAVRELKANGDETPNRTLTIPGQGAATYSGEVEAWSLWTWPLPGSTAQPNVQILDNAFDMPQLNTTRRIWAYLPLDYDTSTDSYPVIYGYEAQWLFDAKFIGGEGRIDESLNELQNAGWPGAIVIGIDASVEGDRNYEVTPWSAPNFEGEGGVDKARFVVETLKPFVDANFRTKPGRSHTTVMGVSLGGLLALYTAVQHRDVFGNVIALSPFILPNPQLYDLAASTDFSTTPIRVAMASGTNEPPNAANTWYPEYFMEAQNAMAAALLDAGLPASNVSAELHPDGEHNAAFWGREFPDMYRWLYGYTATDIEGTAPGSAGLSSPYPNPGRNEFHMDLPQMETGRVAVFDQLGRRVAIADATGGRIHVDTSSLASGVYLIRVGGASRMWVKW